MFCDFTLKYLYYFKLNSYNIDNNNKLLLFIKNEKKNIIKFIYHNNFDITIDKIDNIDDILVKYSNVFFVSKQIKNEIKKLNNTYLIKWNNNKIYIKMNKSLILNRIKLIIYFIEYLKYISHNNKIITIYLILSSLTKTLPQNEIMGVDHVNSGYTDNSEDIIYIWRLEECEKVIFHEIIHFLDLDRKYEDINIKLNLNDYHNYHEVITDYYGILYHIIYLSLITKKKILELLKIELGFIRNQCMLINFHFNLGNWKKELKKKVIQNSSVFSYYILKYMLFNYIIKHNIILDNDTNLTNLFNKIINYGLKLSNFIDIKSTRMTLLQLN
jgi:hypothetical protein